MNATPIQHIQHCPECKWLGLPAPDGSVQRHKNLLTDVMPCVGTGKVGVPHVTKGDRDLQIGLRARLSEQTVQHAEQHIRKARRGRRKKAATAVSAVQLHPKAWATARRLAQEQELTVLVVSPVEFLVTNKPRRRG